MTTEDESPMPASLSRLDPNRPISDAAVRSPPWKPNGGARILSFLLQALVMAVSLSFFFFFASLAALVLLHLFVAGRSLRRRRRRRRRFHHVTPTLDLLHDRRPVDSSFGLSSRDLKSLPSFHWTAAAAADCAVCLEGFRVGDRCRDLPACGHSFHRDCVDRWLMRSPACPICRRGVMPAVGGWSEPCSRSLDCYVIC